MGDPIRGVWQGFKVISGGRRDGRGAALCGDGGSLTARLCHAVGALRRPQCSHVRRNSRLRHVRRYNTKTTWRPIRRPKIDGKKMMDQSHKLSATTIALHWALALGMVGMLAFGLLLEDMPKGDAKSALIWWHKGLGVAILVFALLRIGWRLVEGMPQPIASMPAWQHRVSAATHGFLLLGTLAMPVSGMMMSLGGGRTIDVLGLFVIPAIGKVEWMDKAGHIIHGLGGKLLIAAIVLHVAGALKHHVVDKDATLARMLGRRSSARLETVRHGRAA
jgi:cytochrome b561